VLGGPLASNGWTGTMIQLTDKSIDPSEVLAAVASTSAGAIVLFLGTTRDVTHGRRTLSLDYESYPAMAAQKLAELAAEAQQRWPLTACALVHRLGNVPPGEASVAVAVSAPHRKAAFAAGEWLIDTLKEVVPIWKCENWADGERQWVHPVSEGTAASLSVDKQDG
jgi:molybdopterin synthase catalytic subunit